MSEQAEIAKSVAKALGLKVYDGVCWGSADPEQNPGYLNFDGSNVFSTHWFKECVMWLMTVGGGGALMLRPNWGYFEVFDDRAFGLEKVELECPAAEFPARCIHALTTVRRGDG